MFVCMYIVYKQYTYMYIYIYLYRAGAKSLEATCDAHGKFLLYRRVEHRTYIYV